MIRTTHGEHTATRDRDHPSDARARPDGACRARLPLPAAGGAWHRKALRTALRMGAFAGLAMLLLEPLVALADNYERGNYSCIGFAETEQLYRSDPQNVYYQLAYAHCLIVRGGQDHGALGMGILHNIADGDHPARVRAAWKIAEYIETGGTFGATIDEDNINEAIQAYVKVVFLINLAADYPAGNDLYEGLCCKLGEGAMRDQGASCSPYDSALARRSCSHAMASVRAHGPRPKARSTIRASPTMPPWRANIPAWPLRSARITSKPLIVA